MLIGPLKRTDSFKTFGEKCAVDGVNLNVRAGTIYGVLGSNGAGKTTIVGMLATLLRPDVGSIVDVLNICIWNK